MERIACLLVSVGFLFGFVVAQPNPYANKCGQMYCRFDEYCAAETNRCTSCTIVCNSSHQHHDSMLCVNECRGYLLDSRYLLREEYEEPVTNVDSAHRQARTAMIISSIALAIVLLVLIILCQGKISWRALRKRFIRSKNRIKHYPTDLPQRNPHAALPKQKLNPDLRREVRNPEPPGHNNPQPLNARDLETRSDGILSAAAKKTGNADSAIRHPAEDITLDFSYDNIAMNVIPPEQPLASPNKI